MCRSRSLAGTIRTIEGNTPLSFRPSSEKSRLLTPTKTYDLTNTDVRTHQDTQVVPTQVHSLILNLANRACPRASHSCPQATHLDGSDPGLLFLDVASAASTSQTMSRVVPTAPQMDPDHQSARTATPVSPSPSVPFPPLGLEDTGKQGRRKQGSPCVLALLLHPERRHPLLSFRHVTLPSPLFKHLPQYQPANLRLHQGQ
ncbi:hypothetical protein H8959_013918 [Pygathrix nigripes]